MSAFSDQIRDLDEFGEITLLLHRHKPESREERNNIREYCGQRVDFEVGNPVTSRPKRSARERAPEQIQNRPIPLGDVETQRDFPASDVIASATKRYVEAPFPIGETCEVTTNGFGDSPHIKVAILTHEEPFLLIVRTPQIVTHFSIEGSTGGFSDVPAYGQVY